MSLPRTYLGAEAPQVVAEDHGFVADAILVARLFDAAATRQQEKQVFLELYLLTLSKSVA